jgi:hypothetical protein
MQLRARQVDCNAYLSKVKSCKGFNYYTIIGISIHKTYRQLVQMPKIYP